MEKNVTHKIGDRVVCIDAPRERGQAPLVLNKEYIVLNTQYCPNCNMQSIDVGYKIDKTIYNGDNFYCLCGYNHKQTVNTHWAASFRFRKVDDATLSKEEDEMMESLIEKVLEPELV